MRVHIVQSDSHALKRVARALVQYAPAAIEFVSVPVEAELIVLPVVGRQDRMRAVSESILSGGRQYAVIQYCLRSTLRPNTEGWLPLWRSARLVWSYYNLPALCVEDGVSPNFPFYLAPLGVESIFSFDLVPVVRYVIATSGQSYMTESVREAIHAAQRVGRKVAHLGPEMPGPVTCFGDLSDASLVAVYNMCEFVSGLRRTEGFELPAAEGLLCGARPVLFDRPHYRQWYDGLAEFILETPRPQVIDVLEQLFRIGARPVTNEEICTARERFDWHRIIDGFWERVEDA